MEKEALFYDKLTNERVRCNLCAHRCLIIPGQSGRCSVRKNFTRTNTGTGAGILYTTVYGRAVAAGCDPIEKKPLYHFLPGTTTYSIATVGCNFTCVFCQNWQISQADKISASDRGSIELMPDQVVFNARSMEASSISYTYTEPTVFFEYALDTAKLASAEGLKNIFVTNGFMSGEALEAIAPYLDAANVDLKFFNDEMYRKVAGGRLEPVLDTIRKMKELGIWVEITTLIIPELNDSEEELSRIAGFIADVDPGIPWHISRFFPNYKFPNTPATPLDALERAVNAGQKAGLKYIYKGNTPDSTITSCPSCGKELIIRTGYHIDKNYITAGTCMSCGEKIEGVWSKKKR
ncbi:MAG: AmmeMemoRadiSam system radical SAM enzyme [Elusimicrobiota bacterium]